MWRVLEIHKIVRTGKYPNCSSLAEEIEVTAKTIQRDVTFMRDQLGMPLEYDKLRHGYHYTREVHEFPMLQLSRNDLVALFLARQLGFRIVELPVTCVYHAGSSVNRVGDVLNMLGDVLAVRWRHRG